MTSPPLKTMQNTENSPGDLRRLAVTQTPVKNHQLTLVRKISKRVIIVIIILGYCQIAEKAVEYESDSDTNYSWYPWNSPPSLKRTLWELEIRGRIKIIQTTALSNQLEYLEESWRPVESCCLSDSSQKPLIKTGVKDSHGVKNIPSMSYNQFYSFIF